MHIFYTPNLLPNLEMPEDESLHCAKVLRLKEDDEVILIDGKGQFFKAKIVRAHPKRCAVEIIEQWKETPQWNFRLHLAVAPTKNLDRMEWFAEKATEIGINELTLLRCKHSERKEIKDERLKRILISATKQSFKATLPKLNEMTEFNKLITTPFDGLKFIAHCHNTADKKPLAQLIEKGKELLILIGPEGDFSEEEVALAYSNGFIPVSLGESRLRTETAALVACHTPHVINSLT